MRRIFIRSYGYFAEQRWQLISAALLGTLALLSSVALLATSGWLISAAALQPPVLTLEVAIVAVRTFGLSRSVLRYAERLVSHSAAFTSLTVIRARIFNGLRNEPRQLLNRSRGSLLTTAVSDTERLVDFPIRVFVPLVSAVLTIVIVSFGTYLIVPMAGVVLFLSLVGSSLAITYFAMRVKKSQAALAPLVDTVVNDIVTMCEGLADLTVLGLRDTVTAQFATSQSALNDRIIANVQKLSIGSALSVLGQACALLGGVIIGCAATVAGTIDGRVLAVVILIPLASFEAVTMIPAAVIALRELEPTVQRIDEVTGTPSVAHSEELLAGALHLQSVSAGWADTPAITNVTLTVGEHEIVGLTGPSGSGKSTVAAVLSGFLDVSHGTYSIGSTELHSGLTESLHAHVGLINSDQHIFATTIAENLRIANSQATDEELMRTIDAVGLTEWVASSELGIERQISGLGGALSGGERQRLLIARALLAKHPVFIVDEPTEFLDAASAERVLNGLLTGHEERSLVLISHSDRDLQRCGRVISMANGEID